MRLKDSRMLLAISVVALMFSRVHAANVVWPAVNLGEGGMWAGTHYVSSDISSGGPVIVWMILTAINPAYATVEATTYSTGNAAIWFQTSYGDAVDADALATAPNFCNPLTGELGTISITRNKPFYIGFMIWGGDPGPIYGWASIYWNGTTLVLLDSAAETTGAGIFAGTYTPMPEPSTAGLALAGLAAFALRRRTARGALPAGAGRGDLG